jgi:hypothetical protein
MPIKPSESLVRVRIKVTRRRDDTRAVNDRLADTFWQPLRELDSDFAEVQTSELEGRLLHEFGGKLKNALIDTFDRALSHEDALLRNVEYFMRRGPRDGFAASEFLAGVAEARSRAFESSPALHDAREKRVLAPRTWFIVRDVHYSSLLFGLDIGPVETLATIFDNNFEAFQMFLAAYVPSAFGETFDGRFADQHAFEISAVDLSGRFAVPAPQVERPAVGTKPEPTTGSRQQQQAEWLWKLANGSLLVPFLIALIVMLYAVRELARIRDQERDAMRPIIEHQLELLKEDRLRLKREEEPNKTNVASDTSQQPATDTTTAGGVQKPTNPE